MPSSDAQDDAVDIIAWRRIRERANSTVVLFGNCATGRNLDELRNRKCLETNPDAFLQTWFETTPVSPCIQAFYFPHSVDLREFAWKKAVRHSKSIFFDRCQVAYWAGLDGRRFATHQCWVEEDMRRRRGCL
jgi:hypothetical protein